MADYDVPPWTAGSFRQQPMAIFQRKFERHLTIDDTETLSAIIESSQTVDGHTVSAWARRSEEGKSQEGTSVGIGFVVIDKFHLREQREISSSPSYFGGLFSISIEVTHSGRLSCLFWFYNVHSSCLNTYSNICLVFQFIPPSVEKFKLKMFGILAMTIYII